MAEREKERQVSLFSAETRRQKRPLWKGDDTLCADGRSCEFFLKCWMSAGLLDGSCGGIMFACCQRRDSKALTDYNLIEAPRDQSGPLPLDLYTETASDDRKSFLRRACHPYSRTAHTASMSSLLPLSLPLFYLALSWSFSFSLLFLLVKHSALSCTRMCSKHVLRFSPITFLS